VEVVEVQQHLLREMEEMELVVVEEVEVDMLQQQEHLVLVVMAVLDMLELPGGKKRIHMVE
jgi:hypothetical protein